MRILAAHRFTIRLKPQTMLTYRQDDVVMGACRNHINNLSHNALGVVGMREAYGVFWHSDEVVHPISYPWLFNADAVCERQFVILHCAHFKDITDPKQLCNMH